MYALALYKLQDVGLNAGPIEAILSPLRNLTILLFGSDTYLAIILGTMCMDYYSG
jgi:hypothetical protein